MLCADPTRCSPVRLLPDQLPDQGHGQPGGQAAAERDQGAVGDQGGRVGQAGPLVGRWVQAHGDPPAVRVATPRPAVIAAASTGS